MTQKYILGPDQILLEKIALPEIKIGGKKGILYGATGAKIELGQPGATTTKKLPSSYWYRIVDWGFEIEKKIRNLRDCNIEYLKKGQRVVIKDGWEGSKFYAALYTEDDTKIYEVIEERMIALVMDVEYKPETTEEPVVKEELDKLYEGKNFNGNDILLSNS